MGSIAVFIFWFAFFVVFYAYAGYPMMLAAIALCQKKRPANRRSSVLPKVSLLISAYNEETVIADKIENSLALEYPRNKLEIVVISDGSTDATDSIVARYRERNVVLKRYEGHLGKTACLNKAVPEAAGEIIVFSDANSQYDRKALLYLVETFSDPAIGWVTGRTEYVSPAGGENISSAGIYTRIERLTKSLEGRIGSCVGADGAIFGIRKSLYRPLKDYDINDFVIPAKIIQQGYRGILAKKAFCIERTAASVAGEFRRHIRITATDITGYINAPESFESLQISCFFAGTCFSQTDEVLCALRAMHPFPYQYIYCGNRTKCYLCGIPVRADLPLHSLVGGFTRHSPVFSGRPIPDGSDIFCCKPGNIHRMDQIFRGEKFTTWATGR